MSGGPPDFEAPDLGAGERIKPRLRGEPLLILLVVMGAWAGGRSLWWQEPHFIEPARLPSALRPAGGPPALIPVLGAPPVMLRREGIGDRTLAHAKPMGAGRMRHQAASGLGDGPVLASGPDQAGGSARPVLLAQVSPREGSDGPSSPVAHQMLWMAAMANLPLPAAVEARGQRDPNGPLVVNGRRHKWLFGLVNASSATRAFAASLAPASGRWSGDGWLLVRRGGDSMATGGNGAFSPTYGANQIGAVLRYRMVGADSLKPTLFLRGYGAMNGTGEREAAFGVSLRPVARLPVVAMAEMRASRFMDGTTHARPAISLVSEVPVVKLGRGFGGGLEMESYAQAGYVGGAAATPFVDGQLRVEQIVKRLGHGLAGGDVRLGVGAWGGAQDKVSRLDMGPSLRVTWSNGHQGGRMALDWRMRVEGNAAPSSGPALTLSAGF